MPALHDDVVADSVGPVVDNGFGENLTPPDEYDPFGISKPIVRATSTGPVEPLLDPKSHPDPDSAEPAPKIPYWDRPKQPRDWYWFLGRLGSGLIILGLLMFLFVGYQLWGTGIEEAQSQDRLENAFQDLVGSTTSPDRTTIAPSSTVPTSSPVTTTVAPEVVREPVVIDEGDPIAVIEIPAIGIEKFVVAGVQTADLKKGPGHYPDTPMPGELGNVAIAGHRTTYGEPFRHVDELEIGDEIIITDLFTRRFVYRVTGTQIVGPTDSWVVSTTDPTRATLTLTTCHPEFSAKQRLIVYAELDISFTAVAEGPAAVYRSKVPQTTTTSTIAATTTTVADSALVTTVPNATTTTTTTIATPVESSNDVETGVFESGWFSDGAAWPHVLFWGALELLVVWGAWQVAKRYRNRLIGAAVGFVPFFFVLYFVFQNVNRLLPPNL